MHGVGSRKVIDRRAVVHYRAFEDGVVEASRSQLSAKVDQFCWLEYERGGDVAEGER